MRYIIEALPEFDLNILKISWWMPQFIFCLLEVELEDYVGSLLGIRVEPGGMVLELFYFNFHIK